MAFDPDGRLVFVPVYVAGPAGGATFRFALDTAATRTSVSGLILERLGYRESQATGRHPVRTAGGGLHAPLLPVAHLVSLGQARANFPVLRLPLPPTSLLDGLLGLDLLRGLVLTLDFDRGVLDLDPPRRWWRLWR